MVDLTGRTAVVTGAARGQGAAEAAALVRAGAHVLLGDVLDDEGAAVAEDLGPRARYVHLDVTQEPDWAAAIDAAVDWPAVQVLVNNAGIHWNRDLLDERQADMTTMLSVNVVGAMLGMQAVAPAMSAAGNGSIINVCSVLGLLGGRGSGAYTASKWALRGLTKSAAIELGPRGIRVNAIHPGYIDTPMLAQVATGRPDDYYDFVPLGRAATTDEVADLVCYLASDDSSYLSGGDFAVDGGLTAGGGPRGNDSRTYRQGR